MTEQSSYQFIRVYADHERLCGFTHIADHPEVKGFGHRRFLITNTDGGAGGYLMDVRNNTNILGFNTIYIERPNYLAAWRITTSDSIGFLTYRYIHEQPILVICLADKALALQWITDELQRQANTLLSEHDDASTIDGNRRLQVRHTIIEKGLDFISPEDITLINNVCAEIICRIIKKLPNQTLP